jgi:phosphonate transport system substrate-binding protein
MKKLIHLVLINIVILLLSSCSSPQVNQQPFIISALPDQKPEILQPLYDSLASYLQQRLGIPVKYQAASTYDEVLNGFRLGKLDMVWFGGLTGVEARLGVDGAEAIVQRDIDAGFQTVFIANTSTGLKPFSDVKDLQQLKGHSFTFGSSISTSGRLMPEYYLRQAGVQETDFKGPVYFSGSHDATLMLVQSGIYEAGALNIQIWKSRVKDGTVDAAKVIALWETPHFYDYHWVIHPHAAQRYGKNFIQQVQNAFFGLDGGVPDQAKILTGFGAQKFIATRNDNYAQIESIGRQIGRIRQE